MKTRNGIYYDLNLSTYKYKMHDTGLTFIFSSDLHLTKFEEQYASARKEHNVKFNSRYRIKFDFKTFADIMLYMKIEKRGFLIINKAGDKLCLENLLLNGEIVTPQN